MKPVTLSDPDYRTLDLWHLNLSIIQESFELVFLQFSESSNKESYCSIFKVLNDSFSQAVDSFPGVPICLDSPENNE